MLFARWKWYRKWKGGTWYFNRYWFDAGTACFWRWEREFLGYGGGPRTTLDRECYEEKIN